MTMPKRSSPFLDRARNAIRLRHYSIRSEESYVSWTKRFVYFRKRHPEDMGETEVIELLTHHEVGKGL